MISSFLSFLVPRITVKTEKTPTTEGTSQTTQHCLKQNSPSESKPPPVEISPIAIVKTEKAVGAGQTLDPPIKNEPEEDNKNDKNEKNSSSLGIKIVECWSLQMVKEEPVGAPQCQREPAPPPHTAVSCKSEEGVEEMPTVKQEADTDKWQSGGVKRPSTPSNQLQTETGVVHKKFRPLPQPQQQHPNLCQEEGAWPVKVEKDPTSHDSPTEVEGKREVEASPSGALTRAACCCYRLTTCDCVVFIKTFV